MPIFYSSHPTSTCYLFLSDIRIDPTIVCEDSNITLSWHVLAGSSNSDRYTAQFDFNGVTYTSDYSNSNIGSFIFTAPFSFATGTQIYNIGILVADSATPACADFQSDLFVQVRDALDPLCSDKKKVCHLAFSDIQVIPSLVCPGSLFTLSWRILSAQNSDRYIAKATVKGVTYQTIISDLTNLGHITLKAPFSNLSGIQTYPITLAIEDAASSDCLALRSDLIIRVRDRFDPTCRILQSYVFPDCCCPSPCRPFKK